MANTMTMDAARAEAIAWTNARKMVGYTREGTALTRYHWIATPKGARYLTAPAEDAPYCSCRFFQENATCKHLYWLRSELADEARWEALRAERIEWEEFGRFIMEAGKF